MPGREPLTLTAAEWVDMLPGIEIEERIRRAEEGGLPIRRDRAVVRTLVREEPVSFRGIYLNQIERLGPAREGVLELFPERIAFVQNAKGTGKRGRPMPGTAGERADHSGAISWEFEEITAVQPSSRTLQINSKNHPLASIVIPDGSIRFWEELLCAALQYFYRAKGLGEIVDFQPRITTR